MDQILKMSVLPLQGFSASPGALVRLRVRYRDGNLVGHAGEEADVERAEAVLSPAVDVEGPDRLAVHSQRNHEQFDQGILQQRPRYAHRIMDTQRERLAFAQIVHSFLDREPD